MSTPPSIETIKVSSVTSNPTSDYSTREVVFKYIYLLPWILVSVAIALSIAYTRLRYINPVYSASGKVLIKTEKPIASSAGDKLGDVIGNTVSSKVMDDQIELIRSTALARLVVRNYDLQHTWYYKGKFRNRLIHNPQSPIALQIIRLNDSLSGFGFEVKVNENGSFSFNQDKKQYAFGRPFELPQGIFIMQKRTSDFGSNREYIYSWTPELDMARSLAGGIQAAVVTKGANVLNFAYYSQHPKIAEDVVNGFLKAYQDYSLSDKREVSISALAFIDDQLMQAKTDLAGVETNLQRFKEDNKVVALEEQATGFFDKLQESDKLITDQSIKVKLVDFLTNYIKDPKNANRSIPITTDAAEGGVGSLIIEYNRLQLQREISLQTIPKENPIIRDLELSMNKIRNEIVLSLNQVQETNKEALRNLQETEISANSALRTMPSKEKQLLDIARQQKVMEELYSTLLQKKIQTSISSASTLSNIQILEPGYSNGGPVSPNPRSFYITAFLIGLAIPVGFVLLMELLNDKIVSKIDVTKQTTTPLVGDVGHSDEDQALIVGGADRKFISEQFRIIRANLQYLLPKKDKIAMLVTSSMSGEGKSFVATNIAGVMAITGKRTVIMEFDIRKPKILKGLNIDKKNKKGIVNYLVGDATIDEIVYKTDQLNDLYVVPCGPIPPNPAELILSPRLPELFKALQERFDVVVVDTAPIGLVSDAVELGKYVDGSIYIVRHNYTFKKQIQLIDDLYVNHKLPHLGVVINDAQARVGYGNYYGYGGYGYNSYGYRSDRYISHYFDTKTKKRSAWKRLKGVIGI